MIHERKDVANPIHPEDLHCLERLFHGSDAFIALAGRGGDLLFIADNSAELSGNPASLSRSIYDIWHEGDRVTMRNLHEQIVGAGASAKGTVSAGKNYLCVTGTPIKSEGTVSAVFYLGTDATKDFEEDKRLRHVESLMFDTEGIAHYGIWEWDITQPNAKWTAGLHKIYGLDPSTHIPSYQDYLTRVHPDDRQRVIDATNGVFHRFQPYSHDERIYHTDGSLRYLHTWAVPVLDEQGKLRSLMGVCLDITERKLAEQLLEHRAAFDVLTNLPNRQSFNQECLRVIENSGKDEYFALLLLDLDRFKEVNDTLGHFMGDLVLQQIGPRTRSYLESIGGFLGRLGGDEFGIILPSIGELREAEKIAAHLKQLIREPYDIEGLKLEIDSSVGIAIFPVHGKEPQGLLRCADVAMYVAKKRAEGVALYSVEEDQFSKRRLSFMSELGGAIRENQLILHYQPKFDISAKKICGAEALVRWDHPRHGMVYPGEFIPLAEMSSLITPLTRWVLDAVLTQWQTWREQGLELNLSLNLSVRTLLDDAWPDYVAEALMRQKVPADFLEFEITESAFLSDPQRALRNIKRLHDLNIVLSIDDFGSGYSSLGYLSKLPIQYLKIDKSFISDLEDKPSDGLIVNSSIRLAHTLGLKVIAEGVEKELTLNALAAMKCDIAQGYYLGKPMPAPDLTTFMQ